MRQQRTGGAPAAAIRAAGSRESVEPELDGHRSRGTSRAVSPRAAGWLAGMRAEGSPSAESDSGGGDRRWLSVLCLFFLVLPGWRCSPSGRDGGLEFVPLVCPSPHVKTQMEHVHYPEDDCRAAVKKAESRLASGHYRRACEQMAPAAGLPTKVVGVRATACAEAASMEGYEGGSVIWLDICCP